MSEHEIPTMETSDPLAAAWGDAARLIAQRARKNPQPAVALSLWRPWPWVIYNLGKDVENRSWRPATLPGRIALHATATIDRDATRHLEEACGPLPDEAWRTGLVATVTVARIHHPNECRGSCSPWASPYDYHWELTDPRPTPAPTPARGRQRLWRLTPAQSAQLRSV